MLQDKVVIVTGAGGGLGAGIARVCAREGARVTVVDVRGEAARDVADSLAGARAVECDLRDDGTPGCGGTITVDGEVMSKDGKFVFDGWPGNE